MLVSSLDKEQFKIIYDSLYDKVVKIAYTIIGELNIAEDIALDAFDKYCSENKRYKSQEKAEHAVLRLAMNISLKYNNNGLINVSKAEVNKAITSLDAPLMKVIILKNEGFNYNEIASILKLSENNVKSRVFLARKKLDSLLNKEESYVY